MIRNIKIHFLAFSAFFSKWTTGLHRIFSKNLIIQHDRKYYTKYYISSNYYTLWRLTNLFCKKKNHQRARSVLFRLVVAYNSRAFRKTEMEKFKGRTLTTLLLTRCWLDENVTIVKIVPGLPRIGHGSYLLEFVSLHASRRFGKPDPISKSAPSIIVTCATRTSQFSSRWSG